MIIYFTGTGNSQYVAEALKKRLSDEIVNANEYIKAKKKGDFTSERPYVFVFPVYVSTIAEIFANFIRESNFTGNKDAYFVGTCASEMGASPNICKEICEQKGLIYRGCEKVEMPQNYIALFKMNEPQEIERKMSQVIPTVDEIGKVILAGETLDMNVKSKFETFFTKKTEKLYNKSFTKTKKFYATDACVGCSVCEKVCPLNNIEMEEGKPKWIGKCVHCMACINRCPKAAIEYGKKTATKTRYVCKKYQGE